MTGIRGAGEVALEHVAEELAADRAAPRRGADDGDARRLEERPQRGDDGGVVALLDAAARSARSARSGTATSTTPLASSPRQLEAGALEDAEHRLVLGQHLGDEALDPDARRARGELLEQPRADPASLLGVGDGEGRLGDGRVAQPDVVADRDDALAVLVGERAEQRAALGPVGIEQRLDELRPRCGKPWKRRWRLWLESAR